jgi:hypothetical protein
VKIYKIKATRTIEKDFDIEIINKESFERVIHRYMNDHVHEMYWGNGIDKEYIEDTMKILSESIYRHGFEGYHQYFGYLRLDGQEFNFGERKDKVSDAVNIIIKKDVCNVDIKMENIDD